MPTIEVRPFEFHSESKALRGEGGRALGTRSRVASCLLGRGLGRTGVGRDAEPEQGVGGGTCCSVPPAFPVRSLNKY